MIEEVLRRLSVSFDSIEFFPEEDGIPRFSIKTREPEILLGKDGVTLLALNHVVRKLIDVKPSLPERDHPRSGEREENNFIIDVNDYQIRKLDELKQKAKMMAERARFFKSSIELPHMSSYERMVVHSFLAPWKDVMTESVGTGTERRIVIRYTESKESVSNPR